MWLDRTHIAHAQQYLHACRPMPCGCRPCRRCVLRQCQRLQKRPLRFHQRVGGGGSARRQARVCLALEVTNGFHPRAQQHARIMQALVLAQRCLEEVHRNAVLAQRTSEHARCMICFWGPSVIEASLRRREKLVQTRRRDAHVMRQRIPENLEIRVLRNPRQRTATRRVQVARYFNCWTVQCQTTLVTRIS